MDAGLVAVRGVVVCRCDGGGHLVCISLLYGRVGWNEAEESERRVGDRDCCAHLRWRGRQKM